MRKLSPSQMEVFKSCKRKWWFQYVMGIKSKGNEETDIGTFIHTLLKAYHADNESIADVILPMIDGDVFLSADQKDLVRGMILNYVKYDRANPLVREGDEILLCEELMEDYSFVHKGIMLAVKPDLVIKRKSFPPYIDIVDHKTATHDYSLSRFLMHFQCKTYQMVAARYFSGIPVNVVFNVLYKRFPAEPKVNKDGSISKQKIITTAEMYLRAIQREHQDPENYADFLSALPHYTFVERFPVFSYKAKDTAAMLSKIIDDMNRAMSEGVPYGTADFMCDRCEFIDICNQTDNEDVILSLAREMKGEGR